MPHKSTYNTSMQSWKQFRGHAMMSPHFSTSPVQYISVKSIGRYSFMFTPFGQISGIPYTT